MPRFEVRLRVDPTYIFGLPYDGMNILPSGTQPVIKWEADLSRAWIDIPEGTEEGRPYEHRFQCEELVDGVRLLGDDNIFVVALEAPDVHAAIHAAREVLFRMFALRAISHEGVHKITITPLEARLEGLVFRRPLEAIGRLYLYDIDGLRSELAHAADLLNGMLDDSRLGHALRYFAIGDDLAYITEERPPEDYLAEIAPVRFLQYWKALTSIVGDPSNDKDHQSRPNKLGLGRHFFRHQVLPLNKLRDQFGVAHVLDPNKPQVVTQNDVSRCRKTAGLAINAYVQTEGAR